MKLFKEHPLPWSYSSAEHGPDMIFDSRSNLVASSDQMDYSLFKGLWEMYSLLLPWQEKMLGHENPHEAPFVEEGGYPS